jgi:predicted metal-binding membrane protein
VTTAARLDAPGPAAGSRTGFVPVVVLSVLAGAALWWWSTRPVGTDQGAHGAHGMGTRNPLVAIGVFTAAWVLMTVATMLPTALPVLDAVGRVTGRRPDRRHLAAAVVAGFLAVWTVAGLAAALVEQAVHHLAGATPAARPQWIAAGVLAVAGAWQLSGLTARCLRGCRSPAGFLHRHWGRPATAARRSLAVGLDYGRSCLGCCAALMAVMLVVGMGNLAGMYALALVGAVEKHTGWGPALVRPVGVALLAAAAVVALRPVTA